MKHFWRKEIPFAKPLLGFAWVNILPTQTMHYYTGNPSKLPTFETFVLFDTSKKGNLVTPDLLGGLISSQLESFPEVL